MPLFGNVKTFEEDLVDSKAATSLYMCLYIYVYIFLISTAIGQSNSLCGFFLYKIPTRYPNWTLTTLNLVLQFPSSQSKLNKYLAFILSFISILHNISINYLYFKPVISFYLILFLFNCISIITTLIKSA